MAVGEAEGTISAAGTNADKEPGTDTTTNTATDESTFTAAAVRYPVAPGYRVNVRSGPGTGYGVVKVLPYNARVPINCQCPGTRVTGPYGTTNLWSNIGNGQFVSDSYIKTGSNGYVAPRCS